MQERKKNIVLITYVAIFSFVIPAIFWVSSRSQDGDVAMSPREQAIDPFIYPFDKHSKATKQYQDSFKVGELSSNTFINPLYMPIFAKYTK